VDVICDFSKVKIKIKKPAFVKTGQLFITICIL